MILRLVALLMLFGLGLAPLAQAGPRPAPRADAALEAVFAEQRLALALIRHGDAAADPLALIMAARIQQRIGTRTATDSPLGVAAVLERATRLAGTRQDLLGLIGDVRAEGMRGAVIGPRLERYFAPVDGLQQVLVRFVGGVPAKVEWDNAGREFLEVEILDARGQTVCKRRGQGRDCFWIPPAEGESYEIRIRNAGPSGAEFSLFHN